MIKKLLWIIVLGILLSTNANAGWFGKWSGSPRFDNGKNFYKKYHKEALEVAHE